MQFIYYITYESVNQEVSKTWNKKVHMSDIFDTVMLFLEPRILVALHKHFKFLFFDSAIPLFLF